MRDSTDDKPDFDSAEHGAAALPDFRYYPAAGFWIRVEAAIVDGLILVPFIFLSYFAFWTRPLFLLAAIALSFFYKPVMEWRYGATLGKMWCKLKVVDRHGENLTLFRAYARYIFWLTGSLIGLVIMLYAAGWLVLAEPSESIESVESTTTFISLVWLKRIVGAATIIDCLFVAFTPGKRAIHDYIAGSFCVRKDPC